MKSWIAAWIFVFAASLFVAVLWSPEERRKNLPMLLLMATVMAASGYMFLYR